MWITKTEAACLQHQQLPLFRIEVLLPLCKQVSIPLQNPAELELEELVINKLVVRHNLVVKGSLAAPGNCSAGNLSVGDLQAGNVSAGNVSAVSIKAHNVTSLFGAPNESPMMAGSSSCVQQ